MNQIYQPVNKILSRLQGYLLYEVNGKFETKLSDNAIDFEENLKLECTGIKLDIHYRFINLEGKRSEAISLITYLQRELSSFRNAIALEGAYSSSLSVAADSLIDFLRDEFPSCFNEQLSVPLSYANAKVIQRESLVNKFIEAMNADVADPVLTLIVSDYLQQNGYMIRTYSQMTYYIQFADMFEILISKDPKQHLQTRVMEQLYYVNFNSLPFMSYCGDIYGKHLEEKQSRKTSTDDSYETLSTLGYKPQHERLAFDPTDKTLRMVLKELVNFEQEHLQGLKNRKTINKSALHEKPSIIAQMNVEVLMVLGVAAREAKAVTFGKYVDFYPFVAANIATKNNEGPFTIGGLKNRKNGASQRSALEALRHLENMSEQIKRKFKLNELKDDAD